MQKTPSQAFAETMTIAESGGVVWGEETHVGQPAETLASLAAIEESARAVAAEAARLVGAANDALRGMTLNCADHMDVYRGTAQHAAEAVSTSVALGTTFIARCEQMDAEMAKVEELAQQVRQVKDSLGLLEASLLKPAR